MREIRKSGSMRGRRKRAVTCRACVLLYRAPKSSKPLSFVLRGKPEIHLIVRVTDALGGVNVAGLNVVMEWRKRDPLQPGLPRRATVQ
jgi:hypothetical protein